MINVFAFIGGRSRVGQSTIAAELAFEWVKRGASACILTTRCRVEAMGFDCFELPSLGPPDGADQQRDLKALASDLAQLEEYDYVILDLPAGSADLAIAAGLAGADLVVPMHIEQGTLGEVSGMFKQIARQPPNRPLKLVLNQVRNSTAATEAAERLIASIETKLKLPALLTATLPWDADLAALDDPTALLGMTLPASVLVKAITPLADTLQEAAGVNPPLPTGMGFWKQFQTLLHQPFQRPAPLQDAGAPLELSDPVPSALSATAPISATTTALAPGLGAELARIATSLEQLSKEVTRLRSGLAHKFEFEEDGDSKGGRAGAGEPIRLDFERFRRARTRNKSGE